MFWSIKQLFSQTYKPNCELKFSISTEKYLCKRDKYSCRHLRMKRLKVINTTKIVSVDEKSWSMVSLVSERKRGGIEVKGHCSQHSVGTSNRWLLLLLAVAVRRQQWKNKNKPVVFCRHHSPKQGWQCEKDQEQSMKCWTKVLCVSALIWLSCCCGPSTKTATPPSLSLLISLDCPRISVSGLPSPRIPAGRADFVKNKTRGGSKSVLNGA